MMSPVQEAVIRSRSLLPPSYRSPSSRTVVMVYSVIVRVALTPLNVSCEPLTVHSGLVLAAGASTTLDARRHKHAAVGRADLLDQQLVHAHPPAHGQVISLQRRPACRRDAVISPPAAAGEPAGERGRTGRRLRKCAVVEREQPGRSRGQDRCCRRRIATAGDGVRVAAGADVGAADRQRAGRGQRHVVGIDRDAGTGANGK